MKVLIISCVFPPEPVVSAGLSFDLALALSIKNQVTVLHPRPTRPMGYCFSESSKLKYPFKHVKLKSYTHPKSAFIGRFRESYSFGRACATFIREHQKNIDVIYLNSWPLFSQYFVVKDAKKLKIPVIIHIQDIYPESLVKKIPFFRSFINSLLLPLDSWTVLNTTKVIAISQKMKDHLVKTRKINPSQIEVVANWQNEQPFINVPDFPVNYNQAIPIVFMYLGNIGPVAGLEFIIEAFQQPELLSAKLVIAGSGSVKEKLMQKASEVCVANIEFLSVPEGKVPETQSKADIMLLPVKKGAALTSIPSKLPAYMFSAKPIIASVDADSDTATSILEAGCGWVIEPENPDELTNLIQQIISMRKEDLSKMGLKGRNYALDHFSQHANMSKLVDIIEGTVII